MYYFSTNKRSPHVGFAQAVLNGQPADRGLYFPSQIPHISRNLATGLKKLSNAEIAFEVIRPYVNGDIADDDLLEICAETVDLEIPLITIDEKITALELFHGPTLAFKDIGARFMSRCLGRVSRRQSRKTIVIAATSGDTGGAVAAGFHNVDGVEVIILYPKGRVSRIQELQLTTLGGNVTTLELHGTFDDCQAIAKPLLADDTLSTQVHLTSANSINVARWLPQQFYYFFAVKMSEDKDPTICVPSGNFGNLAAGILAERAGLRIGHFIAASNANDVVPRWFESGQYQPRDTIETLSNAMDVAAPSNFVRILEMFGGDRKELKKIVSADRVSDEETAATMIEVYERTGYVLDPHGAVAYKALNDSGRKGIILETAHPCKFDSVGEILGVEPDVPVSVRDLGSNKKVSIEVPNDHHLVREIVMQKI